MANELTNAEYAVLGLLVERPCHGYDLERLIEQRGMREWTELAFSSIYFILKKLQGRGFIEPRSPSGATKKTRKIYAPTLVGRRMHRHMTLHVLREPHALYPSVLLGLANWPSVEPKLAIEALRQRRIRLEASLDHVTGKAHSQPAFLDVLFDYSICRIKSELEWIGSALIKLGENHEN